MEPLDITLRNEIGVSLAPDDLDRLAPVTAEMLQEGAKWKAQILTVRCDLMPYFGNSGEIGGKYILSRLLERQKASTLGKERSSK